MLHALLASLLVSTNPAPSVYAVLDIANEKGELTALSSFLSDDLSMRYASDSGYVLVERGQLRKVMKEQGLQTSGAIDEATIASLGKFLGASRIITGQYYQLGDEYVAMVRVLDVATAKVLRMTKVAIPKSSSTQALAQTILSGAGGLGKEARPSSATSSGNGESVGSGGPLVLEKCNSNGWPFQCVGTLVAPEKGRLVIGAQEPFFLDDGILTKYLYCKAGGVDNAAFDIPKGIKVPVVIAFSNYGKRFRDFRLTYSFAGKEYVIETPPPIH